MTAGLSNIIDAFIKTAKDSEAELKLLKAKMSKEDLAKINAFEKEMKAATKNGDLSKVTEITKKYFNQHDIRK